MAMTVWSRSALHARHRSTMDWPARCVLWIESLTRAPERAELSHERAGSPAGIHVRPAGPGSDRTAKRKTLDETYWGQVLGGTDPVARDRPSTYGPLRQSPAVLRCALADARAGSGPAR